MIPQPYLEAVNISKYYDNFAALRDVTIRVHPGEVVCLVGDNGAGKSTLIQTLSCVIRPDQGTVRVDWRDRVFASPNYALDKGIATVFQDLAVVPMMPVYRNFFLGREPSKGWGPLRQFDKAHAIRVAQIELQGLGVKVSDVRRLIGTLSGGQRQSVAVARAVHFGAKILILDEPTSALGVRQAEMVLDYVRKARDRGIGVVLITHNVQHAYPIGDTFVVLFLGRQLGTFKKSDLSETQLMRLMADKLETMDELGPDRTALN